MIEVKTTKINGKQMYNLVIVLLTSLVYSFYCLVNIYFINGFINPVRVIYHSICLNSIQIDQLQRRKEKHVQPT